MSQLLLLLLLLLALLHSPLTAGGSMPGQPQIRVDLYRASTDHHGGSQLRLVCQASGPLGGLSVRLYCPAAPQRQGPRRLLCFENCARTGACSGDSLCAAADCSSQATAQELDGVSGAATRATELKKFGYIFYASGAGDSQPVNLTFECRYGWRSSELAIVSWGAETTTASALPRVSGSSRHSASATLETTLASREQRVTAAAGLSGDSSAASKVSDSSGRTDGPRLIDNSIVYLAGFSAVGLLSIAVVTVVTYLIVCRRGGRSASLGDEEKAAGEQSTMMEMRPRPDLLPDGERSQPGIAISVDSPLISATAPID